MMSEAPNLFPALPVSRSLSHHEPDQQGSRLRKILLPFLFFCLKALILLILLTLWLQTFTGRSAELELEDWVARQIWVANVEASLPSGVHLAISEAANEEVGWHSFQIREVHEEGSGFDTNVSPSLGLFRVDEQRSMVEWLNPISGEWDSLSAFLREMKSVSSSKLEMQAPQNDEVASEKDAGSDMTRPSVADGNSLAADLDGDGKMEEVRWLPIDSIDSDNFFYLEVIDDTGDVLWTGPKERSMENAYVFFRSHFGSSFPQLLADIDGNGTVELLAPEPQSDVSATYFRRLSWRRDSFVPMASAPLMAETPGSSEFAWLEGNYSLGTWVAQFGKVTEDGLVQARVTHYDDSGKWMGGAALIRFTEEGADAVEWIQPLSENPTNMIPIGSPGESVAETPEGHFPLNITVAVEFSQNAFNALKGAGSDIKVGLFIDQYGPQYVEEEGVAYLEKSVKLGDSLEVNGVPLSNPGYHVQSDKTYKLTVMVLPTNQDAPVIEAYSAEGAVDWVVGDIQGRTLPYRCKLASEPGEPEMMNDSSSSSAAGPYDPFADVDMDLLFEN